MGSKSRDKGKRGERAAIDQLQPVVDRVWQHLNKKGACITDRPLLQRNTIQSDRGGSDVAGLPWLALEVKNCETGSIEAWWKQCEGQARAGQVPVLLYKANRRAFRARLRGLLPCRGSLLPLLVDISLDDFLRWFEKRLTVEMKEEGERFNRGHGLASRV